MFDFLKNKRHPEFMRSGDGELLEVKEGLVVDSEGKPVGAFQKSSEYAKKGYSFFHRGGLPLTVFGAFAIPVAVFAGLAALTVVGGFAAIFLILMLVESAFGIGVRPNPPRRG